MTDNIQVSGSKQFDFWKTIALYFFIVLSAILLYYQLIKQKSMVLNISGSHIIIILGVIGAIIYFWQQSKTSTKMPTAEIIAQEGAHWYFKQFGKCLDFTIYEVEPITESEAIVFYPQNNITLTYEAGNGVIATSFKDADTLMKDREDREITKLFITDRAKRSSFIKKLQDQGVKVDTT